MCKAQRLQNFAAKVAVGGARKYDHVSPFFKGLKWLRVQEIHSFNICTTMFKALRGFYPEGFLSLNTVNDVTNSVTQQRNSLYVLRTRTNNGARALTVMGPKLWNELPTNITQAHNLIIFKNELKRHLLSTNIAWLFYLVLVTALTY